MRRRTKPRVVWIPPTAENSVDSAGRSTWSITTSVGIPTNVAGATTTFEVPLVLDGTQSDPLNATSSLADIENSGYRLRRIVGKLYAFITQTQAQDEVLFGVTAALIIRRTADDGTSLATAGGAVQRFSPADIDNSMDPWIWRRSWILSDGPTFDGIAGAVTPAQLATQFGAGPGINYGNYTGGIGEGPTIDQKTARIVGPEERLFLDISATNLLGNGDGTNTNLVCFHEFRVLGSMRTSSGNRRNASR